MARSKREDFPGALHHIMNRGIAKRAMFETTRDVRTFLAALAAAARRREIRVLAYCVMTTHFHLVVESRGRLAQAMARVQRDYVRWFNRGRRRDGSLVRGRFRSKRVSSESYLRCLIGYVDRNPVVANIVAKPWDFPHGSARAFHTGIFPRWLDPGPVARVITGDDHWTPASAALYQMAVGATDEAVDAIVGRAIDHPGSLDPWAEIGTVTPARVFAWMQRKARLADGSGLGVPLACAADVRAAVARERILRPRLLVHPTRTPRHAWDLIEVALLRDLTAATWTQIAQLLGTSVGYVIARHADHGAAMVNDDGYSREVSTLSQIALTAIRNSLGRKDHEE